MRNLYALFPKSHASAHLSSSSPFSSIPRAAACGATAPRAVLLCPLALRPLASLQRPPHKLAPLRLAISLRLLLAAAMGLTCVVGASTVTAQQLNFSQLEEAQAAASNPLSSSSWTRHDWLGPAPRSGTYRSNKVVVNGISAEVDVIGAWSDSQNIADNKVQLQNSSVALATAALAQSSTLTSYNSLTLDESSHADVAAAAISLGRSTLRSNELSVAGSSTYAFGAYSSSGRAQSNELTLENGATSELAVGGYGLLNSDHNEVFVDSMAQATTVIGGDSAQGAATDNFVSISGKASSVVGGRGTTEASSNFVDISGTVGTAVAGYSPQGSALYNSLTVWSGSVDSAYGAVAAHSVDNNTVTLSAGAQASTLVGGLSQEGDSIYNVVNVYGEITPASSSSSAGGNAVVGGSASLGNAYLNEVNVYPSATVQGKVVGASAAQDAAYNEVSILGAVNGDVIGAISSQGTAKLNLLRVTSTNVTGDLIAARGPSSEQNTLLLHDAQVTGSATAGLVTNNGAASPYQAAHNVAILRGNTTVSGAVYGARTQSGTPLNELNEIAVDGKVTVGALDGYHRLHLFLTPENDSDDSPNASHVLHVTGDAGLDLRHKEIWVTGLHVATPDHNKLIYVDATDKLLVDETTLIRGDETFVFNAWVPKDDHAFEHELIWVENDTGDTGTDSGDAGDSGSSGTGGGNTGGGDTGDGSGDTGEGGGSGSGGQGSGDDGDTGEIGGGSNSGHGPNGIFNHQQLVDVEHAATLLVTPTASALAIAQGSSLIDELIWPKLSGGSVQPLVAVRGYSFDCKAHGTMELNGASALMGMAWSWLRPEHKVPATLEGDEAVASAVAEPAWLVDGALFVEGGSADFSQDFGVVSPTGSINYGGLGLMVKSSYGPASLLTSMRVGYVESDFSGYYERTSDQVNYDYSSYYGAFGARAQYDFALTPMLTLSPQLRYDLHYLSGDTIALQHKDQQELHVDDMTLHSFKASLQTRYELSDTLTLHGSLFWREIVASTFTGDVENYTIPSYELSGSTYGLNLGLSGDYQRLHYALQARLSSGDLHELSGQAQLSWSF